MKLLVLGGTLFVGRVIVEQALEAGHEVTLFNRGKTNPNLFNNVEQIIGDRNDDLSALIGRGFDALIDTSGYFPRQVEKVARAIEASIEHYIFLSSIAVYADHSVTGLDESAALATVEDATQETLGANYGGFKALCEQTLNDLLPGRALNVRAGLIVGPYDNTGRFSYWIKRISEGGELLAPEPKNQPVQFIDVYDLAKWILLMAEQRISGSFNVIGEPGRYTMASLLDEIRATIPNDAKLIWVDEGFLIDQGIQPWSDLPLWLPPNTLPTHVGVMSCDTNKAMRYGLTTRPLTQTITATHEWLSTTKDSPIDKDFGNIMPQAGLSAEREQELLTIWKKGKAPQPGDTG
ncbi:MAG: NAD-dependent epimerase/dehydratase family protein [Chloroflexales bacterium]|nr:NAD-dependent epimerase/dehydratase family protein [Chloroflexales bacterium]